MKKFLWALLLCCSVFFVGGGMDVKASAEVTKGNYTYFAEDGTLYKMHKKTGKIKKIKKFKRSNTIEVVGISGKWLYLTVDDYYSLKGTDNTWPYICRVQTNGKQLQTLAKGVAPVVSGNYIYYLNHTFSKKVEYSGKIQGIYQMKLDGSKKKRLYGFGGRDVYSWLKLYNGRIYFSANDSSGDEVIYSMKKNGTDVKALFYVDMRMADPYFYKNKMYVQSYNTYSNSDVIYSYNLRTKEVKYLCSGTFLEGDKGTIYYTKGYGNKGKLNTINVSTKKTKTVYKGHSVYNMIPGKKWIIVQYGNSGGRYNIYIQRMTTTGKNRKTITKYFRS